MVGRRRAPAARDQRARRIVWDPDAPERLGTLRAELEQADATAVQRIGGDLRLVAGHTRAFLGAVVDEEALAQADDATEQRGYTYLHGARRLVAYNLRESGMERLIGPPLPYEHAMLGARTAHEWAHLADGAGWVPRIVPPERFTELVTALALEIDRTIASASDVIRTQTVADLAALAQAGSPGQALAGILLTRLPDFRANLVARRFMTEAERETYVRHNIRTLRPSYRRGHLWRMLMRYLAEYQYLGSHIGLTSINDPRAYFVHGTWFAQDFFQTGALDEARFDRLAEAVARLCASFAVDESRFRAPARSGI